MSGLQIGLLVAALALLAIGLVLRSRGAAAAAGPARERTDRVDTVIAWPPKATRLLSPAEREAFALLSRALPDHMVLAQVPISRFVTVPKRNSYADWLRRIGHQCVDLVVCNRTSEVIAVIELQIPDPSDRAKKRLERIERTLKAAELPLHVWQEEALPPLEHIRRSLLPNEPVPRPVPPAPGAVPRQAPPDDDRGLGLPEPPATTTWFDELDSEKAPLGKG